MGGWGGIYTRAPKTSCYCAFYVPVGTSATGSILPMKLEQTCRGLLSGVSRNTQHLPELPIVHRNFRYSQVKRTKSPCRELLDTSDRCRNFQHSVRTSDTQKTWDKGCVSVWTVSLNEWLASQMSTISIFKISIRIPLYSTTFLNSNPKLEIINESSFELNAVLSLNLGVFAIPFIHLCTLELEHVNHLIHELVP